MVIGARQAALWLGLSLIAVYRWTLAGLLGGQCRYYPSCSTYAEQALRCYGPWRGAQMTIWRLLRCHPWSRGGWDPVAPRAGDKNDE